VENLLPKGMLGTSRRTLIAGVAALVLATILLIVYLNHYRNSVKSENSNLPVLRSTAFIPAGTSTLDLAKKGLWEVTSIPKDQLKEGAVTDAAVLHGEVALNDIFPGQQLTVTDFGVTATSAALSGSPDLIGEGRTEGTWRAMSMSVDEAHGLTPQTQTGDRVDVYVALNGNVGLLMQNVLVLAAPNQSASGTSAPVSGTYILRVPTKLATRFAFANDNGQMWFALRPQEKAKPAGTGFANSGNFFLRTS